MKKIKINIAQLYTTTPGPRYISDGPYSGEDFRKIFLQHFFINPELFDFELEIILDGVNRAYPTSFLEEAFGGLARLYGKDNCLRRLSFISIENQRRTDEIINYINECNNKK